MNLSFFRSFASQSPDQIVQEGSRESVAVRREHLPLQLNDVPDVLHGVAEFTTRYASTQAVITYADSVVLNAIGKVIITFGHGTNENAYALFRPYVLYIVFDPNDVGIIAKCNLAAIWWKMIRNGVLDDLKQFFL
jgi:hypothetical protein